LVPAGSTSNVTKRAGSTPLNRKTKGFRFRDVGRDKSLEECDRLASVKSNGDVVEDDVFSCADRFSQQDEE
jgi:hypothetical protein